MRSNSKFSRAAVAAFAAALACALLVAPTARAADPVFPVGSRLGLVPPPGMVASDAFDGFADPSKDAAILIAMLPAAAYSQIEKSMDAEALKKQGVNVEKREPMQLSFGQGFLLTGRQIADKARYRKWLLVASASDFTALVSVQVPEDDSAYPDSVMRAALATLAVRANVPEAEQLSLLPFVVGDFAGFRVEAVLRSRALLLSDEPVPPGPGNEASDSKAPADGSGVASRLFIAAIPGGPKELDERAGFARTAFNEIGGIKDVQVSVSEPLRIGGQSGYQTMAQAKDVRTGSDIMVVQWLRFGGGGYLQMVGIARADDHWTGVLARLRTVRDSVETK
jgi:hypothetical protein